MAVVRKRSSKKVYFTDTEVDEFFKEREKQFRAYETRLKRKKKEIHVDRRLSTKNLKIELVKARKSYRATISKRFKEAQKFNPFVKRSDFVKFTKTSIKEIEEQGIVRVDEKGKAKILKGRQALITQIESFRSSSSTDLMKEQFINNVAKAMSKVNFGAKDIYQVRQILGSLSTAELSYLISINIVKRPEYIYMETSGEDSSFVADLKRKIYIGIQEYRKKTSNKNA